MTDDLKTKITILSDFAKELSFCLIKSGEALASNGEIPNQRLKIDLEHLWNSFSSIKLEVLNKYSEMGNMELYEISTIPELTKKYNIIENELIMEQQKLEWVKLAISIESTNESDDEVLKLIREQALSIYSERSLKRNVLDEKLRPFIALVRLICDKEALTDDELLNYDQLVKTEFPGQVVISLMRNRLLIGPRFVSLIAKEPENQEVEMDQKEINESLENSIVMETNIEKSLENNCKPVEHVQLTGANRNEGKKNFENRNILLTETKRNVNATYLKVIPIDMPKPTDGKLFSSAGIGIHNAKLRRTLTKPKVVQLKKISQENDNTKQNLINSETNTSDVPLEINKEYESFVHPIDQAVEIAVSLDLEIVPINLEESLKSTTLVQSIDTKPPLPRKASDKIDGVSNDVIFNVKDQITLRNSFIVTESSGNNGSNKLSDILLDWERERKNYSLVKELFWNLMSEGKLSYAYRVAEYLQNEGVQDELTLPPRLIHALIIAQHIRHNSGGLMHVLKGDFEQLILEMDIGPGLKESTRNLLAAAMLRPALLAPNTNVAQILSQLHFSGQLYEWMKALEAFGTSYMPLDLSMLRNIRSESGWQAELKQLQLRTTDAIHSLQSIRITFQPALKVWKKWFEPNGFIYSLLQPVLENDQSRVEWLKEQVKKYSDPSEVKIKVNHTDRYEVERSANRHEIIGHILIQIQSNIKEVIDLAREWIDLIDAKPGNTKEYYLRQAKELQNDLRKLHLLVFTELEYDATETLPIQVSRKLLSKVIQNIYDLFDPTKQIYNKEADQYCILNQDFLMIPNISLRENYEPVAENFPLFELISSLASNRLTETEVFLLRLEKEDLEGAKLLLKQIELNDSNNFYEELQRQYDKRLKECRESFIFNINDAVKRVEQDFTLNLLSESERSDLLAHLETMERGINEIYYFPEKKDVLNKMRSKLGNARRKAAERTWEQFQEAGLIEKHPDYIKVKNVLDSGNLHAAYEYLGRFQQGVSLVVDENVREPFKEFFEGKFFSELEDCLKTAKIRLIQDIKRGRNIMLHII
jgi:hypothetical protein